MSKIYTLGNDRDTALSMLPEQAIRKVQVGEKILCIYRKQDKVFAFQALCPHQSASLAEGKVNAFDEVICPLHHYRFDLHSGDVRSGDCAPLKTYPARLTAEGIEITI